MKSDATVLEWFLPTSLHKHRASLSLGSLKTRSAPQKKARNPIEDLFQFLPMPIIVYR